LGTAHGYDAIHLALLVQVGHDLDQPIDHDLLATLPVAEGDEISQFVPACPGYFLPGDIGRDGWLAQDAGVDHQWGVSVPDHLVMDKSCLGSLCIQCADDDDLHVLTASKGVGTDKQRSCGSFAGVHP
jgi:hypothetical protein